LLYSVKDKERFWLGFEFVWVWVFFFSGFVLGFLSLSTSAIGCVVFMPAYTPRKKLRVVPGKPRRCVSVVGKE